MCVYIRPIKHRVPGPSYLIHIYIDVIKYTYSYILSYMLPYICHICVIYRTNVIYLSYFGGACLSWQPPAASGQPLASPAQPSHSKIRQKYEKIYETYAKSIEFHIFFILGP